MHPQMSASLRWLVGLLALDVVVATVTRLASLERLVSGDVSWTDYVAVPGLLLLPPLAVLTLRVVRQMGRLSDRAAEDRGDLQALASTSHEWLWRADVDLVVTSCSPAVAGVLGHPWEHLIGRCLLDFVHPDDLARASSIVEAARLQRTGWNDVEMRWQHRNGSVVRLQGSGASVLNAAGVVVGFRGARRPVPKLVGRRDIADTRRRVREVLQARNLSIALQPIVHIARCDGDTWTAVEALARFSDGRGPDVWFADAQAAGLGVDLELLAIEKALERLALLPADVSLSINASPSMILDPRLRRVLAPLGTRLRQVTLEVTEHAAVSAYDDIRDALAPLREAGMLLAIDDTGAGYASFTHVLTLRPDVIKVDRSLIAGIDGDAGRRALVTAIVLLALELDATVTAEGVETAEELASVRHLGVDHAQGYLLAKPTTSEATWQSWRSRRWVPDQEQASVTAR